MKLILKKKKIGTLPKVVYDLLVEDRKRKILYSSLFFWQKRNFDVSITIKFDWRAKQDDTVEIKNDMELKDMIYMLNGYGED